MIETQMVEQSIGRPVASISRKPYSFQTSHRIDELTVELMDGTHMELLLKDLRKPGPSASGSLARPDFLDNPRREQEAYHLLGDAGLGIPIRYNAGGHWLLLERVQGVELWQVGDLEAWVMAARWLARLHAQFVQQTPTSDHLIRYDADYFRQWPARAKRARPGLGPVVARYDRVIEILTALPTTLVHGEFYPSNVLVSGDRIATVDWEMAGTGPGVLDLAALVTGWGEKECAKIVEGYSAVPREALDAAQLHLSLQWLGWSHDWIPPPEHTRDWLAEALAAAERLGL